jgi:type I restriction enzyme, R subunit
MWLTGFDAPCMHTMYVDKPMRGHGLMQAIARVNRVFRDKPAGLVVDYINIAQNLKNALSQYSQPDQDQTGIDEDQAVSVMLEKYEIVRAMFHGFNYDLAFAADAKPQQRSSIIAQAIDWVLTMHQAEAAKETTAEGKKRAHRRYGDAVLDAANPRRVRARAAVIDLRQRQKTPDLIGIARSPCQLAQ